MPDTQANPAATYSDYVYVYPRDLASRLQHHPLPESRINYGYMEIVFHNGVVITISSTVTKSPIFPYSVGGIAIGDPVTQILKQLPTKPVWNASHDHLEIYPYPIGIDVHPYTGIIAGILITDAANPAPGHAVRFYFNRNVTTGLVNGYSVTVGSSTHPAASH